MARRFLRGFGWQLPNANIRERNLRSLRCLDRRRPTPCTIAIDKENIAYPDPKTRILSPNPELKPLPILRDRLELSPHPVASHKVADNGSSFLEVRGFESIVDHDVECSAST